MCFFSGGVLWQCLAVCPRGEKVKARVRVNGQERGRGWGSRVVRVRDGGEALKSVQLSATSHLLSVWCPQPPISHQNTTLTLT